MKQAGLQQSVDTASDLEACAREPIHIPGSIQPHGILLVLDEKTRDILHASGNVPRPGNTLEDILGEENARTLVSDLTMRELTSSPFLLRALDVDGQGYLAIGHRHDGKYILEFEKDTTGGPRSFFDLYPYLHNFIGSLERAQDIRAACEIAAQEIRRLTNYARVLVYRFDEDWHGEVIAEDIEGERMPSLLGHHFPASDIPAQARELYRLNRVRIIPDAMYQPVPLLQMGKGGDAKPVNLSFSSLRSVSPVHVEYMKNMKTISSMSISLLVDGKLWGLISCHHPEPLMVPFDIRTACEFIGQFLIPHIAAYERTSDFDRRIDLKAVNARLLTMMTGDAGYASVLQQNEAEFLSLMRAGGGAIVDESGILLLGKTPQKSEVEQIANFVAGQDQEIFSSSSLEGVIAGSDKYKETASGILAISISKLHKTYIIWFRPEVLQTIRWSGDPRKSLSDDGRIHPRKSFETWKETVRFKSLPWTRSEIEAAMEFRNSIVGIVLKRAEELASLSEELEVSNKELEAFSYTVSHDLRAPFRHIVGYSELLKEIDFDKISEKGRHYLSNIIESGHFAGQMVDNLLHFSKMGRLPIEVEDVDLNQMLKDSKDEVIHAEPRGADIDWTLAQLPVVKADPILMKLVLVNLLANAVKYTRQAEKPRIEVSYRSEFGEDIISVKDNGVGFDMKYVDKLFGVFQRLHRMEDFEGTGIGLANVKRIITRHGGRVWATGTPGQGAEFTFTLPIGERKN